VLLQKIVGFSPMLLIILPDKNPWLWLGYYLQLIFSSLLG
jgi:hypothetical protein